jgi:hypothetical protein
MNAAYNDMGILKKIITGDETGVLCTIPEIN